MKLTVSMLALPALGVALTLESRAHESAAVGEVFPVSTALAEGVSPEALGRLDELIAALVEREQIVGAELLVIKNGRSILHEAYGWSDREAERELAVGSVFCVRSMTKPVIGAAVMMLIEDGQLELDDRVSQYLPAFEGEGSREVTVEQLLTHTSGLPMSLLLGKDLKTLDGIQGVARLWSGRELEFEPGSAFSYSDQGTDSLAALVEVVSEQPVAEFVRARVLEPLGMQDTACVMSEDSPLRARGVSKYAGAPGNWTRFWSPEDAPLFPFFLGSQGLYSTLEDYARFMDLWAHKGRPGKRRMLSSRSVRRVLAPGPYPMQGPTGFPDLRTDYGYLMQLWTGEDDDGEREVVAFGHTGSDGTHAWVFPEQRAMVLYFTQSRGTLSGLEVEEALGELFLGAPFDPNQAAPPFEDYLGYYWEGEGDLYRAIIRDGEDLALEIMGKAVVPLTYIGDDRWKLRPNPSQVLAFDRAPSGDGAGDGTGEVTGYHVGEHQEFKFEPSPDLPSLEDLQARVMATHRMDLLEELGPLRMQVTISLPKLELEGESSAVFLWPDHFKSETTMAGSFEHITYDGVRVQYASSARPAAVIEGAQAETIRLDNPFARFGDWSRWHSQLEVIQRIEEPSDDSPGETEVVYLVRAGDTSGPGTTMYVHTSGTVILEDRLVFADGLGRIGQRVHFGDFREVGGVLLPYRTRVDVANPLIGELMIEVTSAEVGGELADDAFEQ